MFADILRARARTRGVVRDGTGRRPPPEVLDARIHHANLLNSILAKIEANNAGADDALMFDMNGFIAETNATNVFIVRKGDLATSKVGPMTKRLSELYAKRTATEGVQLLD